MSNNWGDFNGDGHTDYVDYKIFTTQVDPSSGEYQGTDSSNNIGFSIPGPPRSSPFDTFIADLRFWPIVALFLAVILGFAFFFNVGSGFAVFFFLQIFIILVVLLIRSEQGNDKIYAELRKNQNLVVRKNTIKTIAWTISMILFFIVAVVYREADFGRESFLKCISLIIAIDSCVAILVCWSEKKKIQKAILEIRKNDQDLEKDKQGLNEDSKLNQSSENGPMKQNKDMWICKKCGRENYNYVTSCTCGQSRLDN